MSPHSQPRRPMYLEHIQLMSENKRYRDLSPPPQVLSGMLFKKNTTPSLFYCVSPNPKFNLIPFFLFINSRLCFFLPTGKCVPISPDKPTFVCSFPHWLNCVRFSNECVNFRHIFFKKITHDFVCVLFLQVALQATQMSRFPKPKTLLLARSLWRNKIDIIMKSLHLPKFFPIHP